MNPRAEFRLDADGSAAIAGELTLDTVPHVFRSAQDALRRSGARLHTVDFAAVERVDSSGLALLLEWEAGRAQADGDLVIRNAPDDLLRLARLCEAQDLLHLDGRATEAGHG